jgi:carbamoyltransferase
LLPDDQLAIGVSGYTRDAGAAVSLNGSVAGVCHQERIVRLREIGIRSGGFPQVAIQAAREAGGVPASAMPNVLLAAEHGIDSGLSIPVTLIDHHRAHAAAAFLTSPFEEAAVIVADTTAPEVSVWRGVGRELTRCEPTWEGEGFSSIFSRSALLLGFPPGGEPLMEALGRFTGCQDPGPIEEWLTLRPGGFRQDGRLDQALASADRRERGMWAARLQCHLADLMARFARDVQKSTGQTNLCLGGGLFYNASVNAALVKSGGFERTFVPVNPGNGGLCVGTVAAVGVTQDGGARALSPFLGPGFSNEAIKRVLDNCKLQYAFLDDNRLAAETVDALKRGALIGWFQGRLEWGRRALGHRSILANPLAPYVAENLNAFLKQRDSYRQFGVAVREEDLPRYFRSTVPSPHMEGEASAVDPDAFRHILPNGDRPIRIQTVGAEPAGLRELLGAFGSATGVPVLINTSFNGFHEPIVCSPRDAVRVFFGSGLDVLVVGNFLLRK